MEEAQALRTPAFVEGLIEPGFADRLLASRLGSTTHISVLDGDGRACAVTCSNGEGSAHVVPGTGIHVNNVMGEHDLNPLGFFTCPPGRRMPSMMAPTVVMGTDGEVELVLGSAGSNRIRSAILQVIVGVVDHGLQAHDAVLAPRAHFEDGVVYAEPGVDADALRDAGREVVAFRDLNLFFGGVQAVERERATGALSGAGRPAPRRRRGGCVRRAAAAALAALAALALGACGGEARDLFLVTRSGDVPGARLTLRVTDDGRASCNGRPLVDITSAQLIAARESERDVEPAAKAQLRLAAGRAAGLLLPRAHRGGRRGVERRLAAPARGAVQAGQAHARRGQGPLPPGALVTSASALQQSRFRHGRSRKALKVDNRREGESMADNRGVAYMGAGKVEVQPIDFPKLELQDGPGVHPDNVGRKTEHGVILKIVSTNICGSDQHMVRGRTTAPEGLILGHEITGEVIEAGRDVEFIKVGDLVSVPFNIACGRCRNCKEQQHRHLPERQPRPSRLGLRLRGHGRLGRRPGRVRDGPLRRLEPPEVPRQGPGDGEDPRPDDAVGHLPDGLPRRLHRGRGAGLDGLRRGRRARSASRPRTRRSCSAPRSSSSAT